MSRLEREDRRVAELRQRNEDRKLPYLTETEMVWWKKLLKARKVSFFQQGVCPICQNIIPLAKTTCSKTCQEDLDTRPDPRPQE